MPGFSFRGARKYRNQKVEVDGFLFDSKKEAKRWEELKKLEQEGMIINLRRQVKYEIIPAQYENKKCIERASYYIADFVYEKPGENKMIVEDTKGVRTQAYVLKRKLMLWLHGIEIREV